MRKLKKILSYTLVTAMLLSGVMPAQIANAEENNPAATEQTTTPEASEPSTDLPPSTSTTTETPAEESAETSTEAPTPEPLVSEYKDTGLSPVEGKVLVIDPGHCKRHTGASGNGLKEEVINLDISLACREYLDKYGDITVYMTREDGSCCEDLKLGDCLSSRNNYAIRVGADFLVSMHINSGSSSGANVLAAYKSGYNDEVRVETQKFGKIALKKLKEIGIANRGFLLRKSENGTRYSNGKLSDYYSIVRRGVVSRIPSVIIEHGYVTSSSDCNKFFKTKAKRKKVGEADAKAIVEYFGLNKMVVEGTFTKTGTDTYFVAKDGAKTAGWVKEDGKWYFFDRMTGKQQFGFATVDDRMFYFSPNTGELITGWFTVNSTRYLAKGDGEVICNRSYNDGLYTYLFDPTGKQYKKGFRTVDGDVYYVNSKNHVVYNCVTKIKGKYYGFDEAGKRRVGYQQINGKYYYFNPETGAMAKKAIVQIDDASYYFGSKGTRVTGFVTIKKAKYYFIPSTGKMAKGWKKIKGKYYYFSKKTGKMQKNKKIGKYYVNANGVRTKKK